MNVVFVEPFFPRNQREFARALAEAGATVIGVGEYAYVRMRHPDCGVLRGLLDEVRRTLHVHAW